MNYQCYVEFCTGTVWWYGGICRSHHFKESQVSNSNEIIVAWGDYRVVRDNKPGSGPERPRFLLEVKRKDAMGEPSWRAIQCWHLPTGTLAEPSQTTVIEKLWHELKALGRV